MNVDIENLESLAKAAGPNDPWYKSGDLRYADDKTGEIHGLDHHADDFIAAANPAAVLELIADYERLSAIFARPQNMNAKPAEDYETLKKQFGALKTYAACQEKMRDHYRDAAEKLSKLDRSQSAEEIGAERSVNEQLTNDLLRTEDERDQLKAENAGLKTGYAAYEQVNAELKAEVEALRKDAERYKWTSTEGNWVARFHGKWRAHVGAYGDAQPTDWYPTREEAIDAAMSKESTQ